MKEEPGGGGRGGRKGEVDQQTQARKLASDDHK